MAALHPVLLDKLNSALRPGPAPAFTRRDLALPAIPGKAHAVTGMRRSGKTTFLRQLVAELREEQAPERIVMLGFDDDRLDDLGVDQLALLLEEYYRRHPALRGRETVDWFLDEVQLVAGWERFVRRVMDTERMRIVVSGSSSRMLSREIHTSLRGRGTETVVRPFSFREFLRHRGEEPSVQAARWSTAERSLVEARFLEYLASGGFPEAQGLSVEPRIALLQGYVDSVLFRDVVERHDLRQVAALRWIVLRCLRAPGGPISAHRLHADLRSQGLGVAKDAVHAILGYLADAFLVSFVPLASESERQRNSNPRKVYPADTGLIGAFDASRRSNVGHALETAVHIELLRRGWEQGYVHTPGGLEVDFLARFPGRDEELIQVCASPTTPDTWERELRALADAATRYPNAIERLLVLAREDAVSVAETGVRVQPAYEWMLEPPDAA